MIRKLVSASACALALFGTLGVATSAQAEGNRILPFWGQPYPYGYVGTRASCEELRPVETPYGLRYEKVWVCGPVLHARG